MLLKHPASAQDTLTAKNGWVQNTNSVEHCSIDQGSSSSILTGEETGMEKLGQSSQGPIAVERWR